MISVGVVSVGCGRVDTDDANGFANAESKCENSRVIVVGRFRRGNACRMRVGRWTEEKANTANNGAIDGVC